MISRLSRGLILVTLLAPSLAVASGVQALFDLDAPSTSPFPSDRWTVRDKAQNTRLRVDLPKPGCGIRVSDCEDIDILNTLDGFNLQPRLSIPFSGPIDVSTVSSETVLLIKLGDARRRGSPHHHDHDHDDDDDDGDRHAHSYRSPPIGINQIVWDVATNTLHVESDELLEQHARYALIVTRGVRDTNGRPVKASREFEHFRHRPGHGPRGYREALLKGLDKAKAAGFHHHDIVAASVFTTMSVSSVLEKIRGQIATAVPAPADFLLGPIGADGNRTRTVFPLSSIQAITVNEQVSTVPTFTVFTPQLAMLRIIPGAVGTVAFGSYRSPVYLNAERFIPQVATRTGTPPIQGEDQVYFNLFLPSASADRPRPAAGWPVAIYGSGCCIGANKNRTTFNIGASLASRGIATIAIDPAGAGFGPLSTFTVRLTGGAAVNFLSGGRGIDLNGDGTFAVGEGTDTAGRMRMLLGRDGRRQTIADLMQLIRVIGVGMDVDGDGQADLDASRIYYVGHSFGALNGAPLVATEPGVRGAVLNAVGGLVGERLRLAPGNRSDLGELLASRQPSLINVSDPTGIAFAENLPLRGQPPVINTVPGAMEIQEVLERMEWLYVPADAAAFAAFLRKSPLPGVPARPLIVQFAKGDQTVPNPTTTAVLRAGDLADVSTYYRTDLAAAAYGVGPGAPPPTPPPGVEANGHNFLIRMNSPTRTGIARAAQEQVARFFESDGATVIDPDTVGLILSPNPPQLPPLLFEVPIVGPLPEDLGFIVP